MATLYGVNYNKTEVLVPSQKAGVGENGGKIHSSYDSHTFVADVNAIADVVKLMKLPKDCRISFINIKCGSLGTTGIFKIIKEANGVDAAADLVTAQDAGGQAVSSSNLILGDKLGAETQISLEFTEASDAAEDVEVQVEVHFVVA